MSLHRRNCILVDENLAETNVRMDAFKEYSKASCLLECRKDAWHNRLGSKFSSILQYPP